MNLKIASFLLLIVLVSCNLGEPYSQQIEAKPTTVFAKKIVNATIPTKNWNTLDAEDSIVILQNNNQTIPFQNLLDQSFSILQFGETPYSAFDYYFEKYADLESFFNPEINDLSGIVNTVNEQKTTFVILIEESMTKDLFFVSLALAVNKLAEQHTIVVVNFASSNNLSVFNADVTLVQMPNRDLVSEALAAQVLFGGASAVGALSESLSIDLPKSAGDFLAQNRLKYASPEEVGIATAKLQKIDKIAENAIKVGAFPGCQVLVAKEGKIVYSKAFGHHSYGKTQIVNTQDLYDLASLTKVASTTLAAMRLYEETRLDLNASIRKYISGRSALHYIRIRNLLTHTSGLQANIPIAKYIFYAKENGALCDTLFCTTSTPPYTLKVSQGLYFNENELDNIWKSIYRIRPSKRKRYRYSDLNFILLQRIIEEQSGQKLDQMVEQEFYYPLGLRRLMYNPLKKFSARDIAPTVADTSWRHQILRGDVHDEGAALFGGVAGNAGLFSNAEDLAVLFQMLLNGGSYGGTQYFDPSTVDKFTSKYSGVHRGLGFDKPSFKGRNFPYAKSTSASTFGHTGFTGTCVWADPENDILFILLTNRVYPSKYNRKITSYNVRSRMHQVVYDALGTAVGDLE